MLTEDVARRKLCPQMSGDPPVLCYASQCMAWRWAEEPDGSTVFEHFPATGYTTEGRPGTKPSATRGYCGLAGPASPAGKDGG